MKEEFNLNGMIYKQTRFQGYYITIDGEIAQIKFDNEKLKSFFLMRTEKTKSGHLRVEINNKHYLIHRLVYETWSDDCLNNTLVIDHIDANPQNNHINNLRQVTQKINIKNGLGHGNFGHNHNTKIEVTNLKTNEIKLYDCIKDFLIDINAPEYMIKHGTVKDLRKRREYDIYTWRKIDEH